MSRINEIVKFNNLDINLKFSLNEFSNTMGSQQEIDSILETTKQSLINPINDIEVCRFGYNTTHFYPSLYFYFYSSTGNYSSNFINAGFNTNEINDMSLNMLNSFFILELYDSVDPNTQSRILITYVTKINKYKTPYYFISDMDENQFCCLNIPQNFIKSQTNNIVNVYAKYSFYNAKYGNISLFYNDNPLLNTTPEKMYLKIQLNLSKMIWNFIELPPNVNYYSYIYLYELPSNLEYVKRINKTIDSFINKKQNYPNGNSFIDINGSYLTQ